MSQPPAFENHDARHWDGASWIDRAERVVAEAPLQILVNGERFATTMRTPGHDEALVRGLLFTEGIVPDAAAIKAMRFTTTVDPETNYIGAIDTITPPETVATPVADIRSGLMSAACGVCGTRDAARLAVYGTPIPETHTSTLTIDSIKNMHAAMREQQSLFSETGGSHAAAAFDAEGNLLCCYEDVGRHNAVDKVVGNLIVNNTNDDARCITVSGRASYEMVYKIYRAGVGCIASVSAPSTMAITCARRFGVALVGFCRDDRATVYTFPERFTA